MRNVDGSQKRERGKMPHDVQLHGCGTRSVGQSRYTEGERAGPTLRFDGLGCPQKGKCGTGQKRKFQEGVVTGHCDVSNVTGSL